MLGAYCRKYAHGIFHYMLDILKEPGNKSIKNRRESVAAQSNVYTISRKCYSTWTFNFNNMCHLQVDLCFSMSGVSQSTFSAFKCASPWRAVSVTLQELCFSLSVSRQLYSFHGFLNFFKIAFIYCLIWYPKLVSIWYFPSLKVS